jgi:hypothetical protein
MAEGKEKEEEKGQTTKKTDNQSYKLMIKKLDKELNELEIKRKTEFKKFNDNYNKWAEFEKASKIIVDAGKGGKCQTSSVSQTAPDQALGVAQGPVAQGGPVAQVAPPVGGAPPGGGAGGAGGVPGATDQVRTQAEFDRIGLLLRQANHALDQTNALEDSSTKRSALLVHALLAIQVGEAQLALDRANAQAAVDANNPVTILNDRVVLIAAQAAVGNIDANVLATAQGDLDVMQIQENTDTQQGMAQARTARDTALAALLPVSTNQDRLGYAVMVSLLSLTESQVEEVRIAHEFQVTLSNGNDTTALFQSLTLVQNRIRKLSAALANARYQVQVAGGAPVLGGPVGVPAAQPGVPAAQPGVPGAPVLGGPVGVPAAQPGVPAAQPGIDPTMQQAIMAQQQQIADLIAALRNPGIGGGGGGGFSQPSGSGQPIGGELAAIQASLQALSDRSAAGGGGPELAAIQEAIRGLQNQLAAGGGNQPPMDPAAVAAAIISQQPAAPGHPPGLTSDQLEAEIRRLGKGRPDLTLEQIRKAMRGVLKGSPGADAAARNAAVLLELKHLHPPKDAPVGPGPVGPGQPDPSQGPPAYATYENLIEQIGQLTQLVGKTSQGDSVVTSLNRLTEEIQQLKTASGQQLTDELHNLILEMQRKFLDLEGQIRRLTGLTEHGHLESIKCCDKIHRLMKESDFLGMAAEVALPGAETLLGI